MLPAWQEADLLNVGKKYSIIGQGFVDAYFRAGGSLREFLRGEQEATEILTRLLSCVTENTATALLSGYGTESGNSTDRLRRVYVSGINNKTSYTLSDFWIFVVDSPYALAKLVALAPLKVFENSLAVVKVNGGSFYGWAFEAYVHRRISSKSMTTVIEIWPYDANESTREARSIPSDIPVCKEGRTNELCFSFIRNIGQKLLYWIPDVQNFPHIDSILVLPEMKTVTYTQITTGGNHSLDFSGLSNIHRHMKTSLGECASEWTFEYLALCDSEAKAKDLKLVQTGTKLADFGAAIKVGYIRN